MTQPTRKASRERAAAAFPRRGGSCGPGAGIRPGTAAQRIAFAAGATAHRGHLP
jgi:hypothetical protein